MKKYWIVVVVLFALPLLAYADVITSGYDGSPESFFGSWGANAENYARLTPTNARFRLDTIGVYAYRPSTAYGATLNIRVEIFSPNGTPAFGTCGCTTGPGTLLRQYPSAAGTYPMTWASTGLSWFYFLVPHDTLTGPFIVGIKYVSVSSGSYPSLLFDNEAGLTSCCNQYWNYQVSPGVRDNQAMFTGTPGPIYIDARGTGVGAAAPGLLTVGDLGSMGGAALDSTVDDSVMLGNAGGTTLTVTSIVSDKAAFTTEPVGAGIVIAPGTFYLLTVHFTPTAAGDDTASLTYTDDVPGSTPIVRTLWGRGISPTNLILYENWWNGNGYEGGWPVYRFGADDADAVWGLYYSGGHSGGFCNVAAGHGYTATGAPAVDDALMSPFLPGPVGGNIKLNWREETDYPTWVYLHGLLVADSDTNIYVLDTLALANSTQDWADYPTTWYISGMQDTFNPFEIGFEYAGTDADVWYVDDIAVSSVPQLPPTLAAEIRADAFTSANQLVGYAFDPNNDAFTVTAYITPAGGSVGSHLLTENGVGSGEFCLEFTSFLTGAGSYEYYLVAADAFGQTRWPAAGSYTFEVQSQGGATELIHHDGTWNNAHYYFNMASKDAARFTPASYPFLLTGAKVGILNGWPDGIHQQIEVQVYDDDGTAGLPGTLLSDQITGSLGNVCGGYGDVTYANHFVEVVFPSGVVIGSGTFYVAVKNLSDAVGPATEGWTFDTLTTGTTYNYDADADVWTVSPDTVGALGDLMVSAIGYVAPTPPVLTVYSNVGNSTANVYVNGISDGSALPYPMDLYVSSPWTGVPALVAGSPFATSPITYTYPGAVYGFFYGKFLYGPANLSPSLPPSLPEFVRSSLITPASSDVRTTGAVEAATCKAGSGLSPIVMNTQGPAVVIRNEATGESTRIPFLRKAGHPTATTLLRQPTSAMRGPVRSLAKTGFESVIAR